ncbi:hypothetical protein AN398_08100 [Corynebacterium pseudotuberculosis]|nr:hypothetical protein AN902_08125 [Corynebacterium pseudotuberculosis]ALU18078.1 hypothetical protein AN397_08115 [Corynebacterium pseudotuberculosis]ALU20073.1 hypothetical protein AK970_08125 [Corynebacterium pseudotuberculosis]ALU22034.1 hypothetical protein AN398_08100 [Corynebacterium pseudotuberculosis]
MRYQTPGSPIDIATIAVPKASFMEFGAKIAPRRTKPLSATAIHASISFNVNFFRGGGGELPSIM